MADSPNLFKEKQKLIKDLENLGVENRFFPNRDEGDDTDDEYSNASPIRYSSDNVNPMCFLEGKRFKHSFTTDTQGDSNR